MGILSSFESTLRIESQQETTLIARKLIQCMFVIVVFSGHNITFLNGFPADFHVDGLVEITPTTLVQYIQNYTNWDLLGE